MKLLPFLLLALVSATPSTSTTTRPSAPAPFALTLEHRANTWSAACAIGCKWTTVSVTCPNACAVIVDDQGMITLQSGRRTKEKFAFVAEPTTEGWNARAYVGTVWETLSRSCGLSSCRGKVSELGVSAP